MNKEEIAALIVSRTSISQDIADDIADAIAISGSVSKSDLLKLIEQVQPSRDLRMFSQLSIREALSIAEEPPIHIKDIDVELTAESVKFEAEFEESIKQIDSHQVVNAELASRIDIGLADLSTTIDAL